MYPNKIPVHKYQQRNTHIKAAAEAAAAYNAALQRLNVTQRLDGHKHTHKYINGHFFLIFIEIKFGVSVVFQLIANDLKQKTGKRINKRYKQNSLNGNNTFYIGAIK